jgi:hypothetical protein
MWGLTAARLSLEFARVIEPKRMLDYQKTVVAASWILRREMRG